MDGPSVLRLGNGQVLLRGAALLDVVRALVTAQQVTRRDGFGPNRQWLALFEQLAAEAEEMRTTAPRGSAAVPQFGESSESVQDLIDTKEAARMLGCQPRNVRDLQFRGVLESGRLAGGRLLFDRVEIQAEVHRRAEARNEKESV